MGGPGADRQIAFPPFYGEVGVRGDVVAIQGLLEIKDTHSP